LHQWWCEPAKHHVPGFWWGKQAGRRKTKGVFMPFCNKCGTEVPENVNFCQKCGNALQSWQHPSQSSNAVASTDTEDLSLFGYYVKCLKNYANFKGRARRKEFWSFFIIFYIPPSIIDIIFNDHSFNNLFSKFSLLYLLAFFLPLLAVTFRRFHDIGKSGWNILWFFLPLLAATVTFRWFHDIGKSGWNILGIILEIFATLGFISVLYWLCKKGESGVSDKITDPRDGKVYRTVKIGKQTWLAENLNYEAEGSKCYKNDSANGQKYGRLYDWETAKKACPPGWHLPSDAEWQELVNFVGGNGIAGEKLKATSGWNNNGNGVDAFGFSALAGGSGYSDCSFDFVGRFGLWWSATEHDASSAYSRDMLRNIADVIRNYYGKTNLLSVRCVQD